MITFTIPIKTVNSLNGAQGRSRGAVFAKAARRKKERNTARLCTVAGWLGQMEVYPLNEFVMGVRGRPYTVTLTRLSAGTMDSHDGLGASLKSVVDGIADALGVKDNDPGLKFQYEQKKCKRGQFGVEVVIS